MGEIRNGILTIFPELITATGKTRHRAHCIFLTVFLSGAAVSARNRGECAKPSNISPQQRGNEPARVRIAVKVSLRIGNCDVGKLFGAPWRR